MKICGIYKITNILNNQCYIGKSIDIKRRFNEHKTAKDNYYIHVALRTVGIENFTFEIIEECNKEQLSDREKFWISYYDSYENGYNSSLGGEGGLEHGEIKINQYTLDGKYIKTYNSLTEAEEAVANYRGTQISEVCKGNRKSAFRYQWKYAQDFPNKENIDPVFIPDKTRRKIYQLEIDTNIIINEFQNITDASKKTGISRTSISNCLNGYSKSAGGFYWIKKL